jgi:hypothetical protein
LEDSFRAIPGHAAGWTDVAELAALARSLTTVANLIRAVLDPPRRYHVAAACPACGVRMVLRPDAYGDHVLTPTLVVDGTEGCTCLACGQTWPPERLEHLALVLGCPPVSR